MVKVKGKCEWWIMPMNYTGDSRTFNCKCFDTREFFYGTRMDIPSLCPKCNKEVDVVNERGQS